MLVTDIRKLNAKKSIIYLDDSPAFSLYKSEIRNYGIEQGKELSDTEYDDILLKLVARCRERTAYILGRADKSEHDLREKLKQGYYPDSIIEQVITEYIDMGYINDESYAENYIRYNISIKSRNRIYSTLISKGIDKAIINNILNEYKSDNEEYMCMQQKMIGKEFDKKKYDFQEEDRNLFNKIVSSLIRKGFQYDDIIKTYDELKILHSY